MIRDTHGARSQEHSACSAAAASGCAAAFASAGRMQRRRAQIVRYDLTISDVASVRTSHPAVHLSFVTRCSAEAQSCWNLTLELLEDASATASAWFPAAAVKKASSLHTGPTSGLHAHASQYWHVYTSNPGLERCAELAHLLCARGWVQSVCFWSMRLASQGLLR